jgi:hypothetical protein
MKRSSEEAWSCGPTGLPFFQPGPFGPGMRTTSS